MDFNDYNNEDNQDQFDQDFEDDINQLFGNNKDQNDEFLNKKDAVIFAIDCNKQLFLKDNNEIICQIQNCFTEFLKNKIISNQNDIVGLIFFNTDKGKNQLNFKNIVSVMNLEVSSASRIKESVKIFNEFESNYGSIETSNGIHEMLWLCSHEFKQFKETQYVKYLKHDPCKDNQNHRVQAIQQAKQLLEIDIQIELFPLLLKPDQIIFDITKFYQDVISFDLDDINLAKLDLSNRIIELNKKLRAKEFKKRRVGRVLMDLGGENSGVDFKIGVSFYCLINRIKRPYGQYLDGRNNGKLVSTHSYICQSTNESLYENKVGTCMHIGDEKVVISKEEMKQIKEVWEPCLKVVGFQDRGVLKDYMNIKNSYFIAADDDRVSNSSQVFDSLIRNLLLLEKIIIVIFIPKTSSLIRYCALIPQQENYDPNLFQTPPGFHLIFLPFADDLKNPEIKIHQENLSDYQSHTCSKQQLAKTKLLIQALSQDQVDCRQFENFQLQSFYSKLQAIALNQPVHQMQQVDDLLQPDLIGMRSQFGQILDLFHDAYDLQDNDQQKVKKTSQVNPNFQSKKINKNDQVKLEIEIENHNNNLQIDYFLSIENQIKSGQYSKVKVQDLKSYLALKNQPQNGKKDELIQRILNII